MHVASRRVIDSTERPGLAGRALLSLWLQHGLSDDQIAELAHVPAPRVAERRQAMRAALADEPGLLRAATERLDPPSRALLTLWLRHGLSDDQIAELAHVPAAGVAERRRALRAALADEAFLHPAVGDPVKDGGVGAPSAPGTDSRVVDGTMPPSGIRVPARRPSADVHPPDTSDRTAGARFTLTALFGTSLFVLGVGYAADVAALQAIGLLGGLFFGVGTAPLQPSKGVNLPQRVGVACLVGFSAMVLIGSLLVLAPWWHPVLAAGVLGAAAAAVHLATVRGTWRGAREYWCGARAAHRPMRRVSITSATCTLIGTSLWLAAAAGAGHIVPGNGGFLTNIRPAWYVGVVLVLAAIPIARRAAEPYVIVAVVSLVAAITVTPALVYGTPGSQSATKHLELVQVILHQHHLITSINIYDAYSGLFSGVAWLCDLARVHDSLGVATFWPFLIGLARLAELRWLFAKLTTSSFRIWAAITLVVLVDAIGADYFSPQSVGYVIGLGVFALALGGIHDDAVGRRGRAGLLLAAGCALAVTHELSPYVVGGVLVLLGMLNLSRPRWAGLLILAPAGLWALINRDVLSGFISLADIGNLSNFTPPKTLAAPGLHRQAIVGQGAHALLVGVLVLIAVAGVGWWRHRRERWAWACVLCPAVGLASVAANAYGNEGIFRATLFAIPWLAALAAGALGALPGRWAPAAFGLTTVALFGTFLVASFALDGFNVVRRADLGALRRFDADAPPGSYELNLGYQDVPLTVPTSRVPDHFINWQTVSPTPTATAGLPTRGDLVGLTRRYKQYALSSSATHSPALYALWSPTSVNFGVDYGLASSATSLAWRDLILQSRQWRVVYAADGTYLLQLSVTPGGAR